VTATGRVFPLDRDELIECAVMLKKAEEGFVDRVFVPENAQDVAAQHVYGMAINGPLPEREVNGVLRSAYPYRGYGEAEYEQLLRYLTADYDGLEEKNVYAKVWRDENDPPDGEYHYPEFAVGERLIGKRGRLARPIYMQNIGTIPDSFTCDCFTRADDEWVGQLDEDYLDTLETVRERGYAFNQEEAIEGLRSVGAPIVVVTPTGKQTLGQSLFRGHLQVAGTDDLVRIPIVVG
jgi:ATP-dependent Lhr-like helicase